MERRDCSADVNGRLISTFPSHMNAMFNLGLSFHGCNYKLDMQGYKANSVLYDHRLPVMIDLMSLISNSRIVLRKHTAIHVIKALQVPPVCHVAGCII